MTGWNDPSGSTSLVYDARGNITQSTRVIGTQSYVTQYGWTLADRPASITYPSGRIVEYTRDALGRVTAVSQRDNIVATPRTVVDNVTWQPVGPMAGLRHANAIDLALTYDLDWRISRILASKAGTTFLDLNYTWDNADRVTAIADGRVPAQNQSFGHDVLDRLTSATGAYGAWTYGYSANGNRTARSRFGGTAETYTITSGSNRLASVSDGTVTRTLGYDGAGAVTGDNRGGGQDFTYLYDRAGRLTEVQLASQTWARYDLNALGERVAKTFPGTPDQVTHFHYDLQGRLIAETDATGGVLREYIWLDDLPVMARIGGGEYAILADHSGTPHRLVDGSGTVAWDAVWRPFGEIESLTATVTLLLRLPGQYFDAETGIHYNYRRDYDPALGSYIQADPIGLFGGSNRYAYVSGNPITGTDPLGLQGQARYPFSPYSGGILFRPSQRQLDRADALLREIARHDPNFQGASLWPRSGPTAEGYARYVRRLEGVELYYRRRHSCPVEDAAQGGAYLLRDSLTARVIRAGRTGDYSRREGQHGRDRTLPEHEFEPTHPTSNYAEQRGLEQVLRDVYRPPFNRINPINPWSPRFNQYVDAAFDYYVRGGPR